MPEPQPRTLSEFGRRLRDARVDAGYSQESLSHECGLHRTYIGSVERGERNISLLNVVTLSRSLGIDPGELVAGLGESFAED